MKTRCPCCGANASLEVLITHDEARSLMVALAGISDELAKAVLRYLGLFRPGERDLSWARAAKLLGELVPLIQAGEITRKRQSYPAPREAWIWAFTRKAAAPSCWPSSTLPSPPTATAISAPPACWDCAVWISATRNGNARWTH